MLELDTGPIDDTITYSGMMLLPKKRQKGYCTAPDALSHSPTAYTVPITLAGGACRLQSGGTSLARALGLEEPRLGLHERGHVAVVLRQERLRGGDGLRAGAPKRELRVLVGEAGLEVGDLLAEHPGGFCRLSSLCHLRLQRLNLGVLCLELCDVVATAPAHRVLLGRLLALLLLCADVLLLPALLLVLALPDLVLRLLHATGLTLHCDRLSTSCGQRTMPAPSRYGHCPGVSQEEVSCSI